MGRQYRLPSARFLCGDEALELGDNSFQKRLDFSSRKRNANLTARARKNCANCLLRQIRTHEFALDRVERQIPALLGAHELLPDVHARIRQVSDVSGESGLAIFDDMQLSRCALVD